MQENRFHLAGYLAARPTLRSLPSGMAVANVRLGQTYRLSRNDLPAEHTNWFSLVFYGDLATLAMELDKGTNVYVEGSFDQRPRHRSTRAQALRLRSNSAEIFPDWPRLR